MAARCHQGMPWRTPVNVDADGLANMLVGTLDDDRDTDPRPPASTTCSILFTSDGWRFSSGICNGACRGTRGSDRGGCRSGVRFRFPWTSSTERLRRWAASTDGLKNLIHQKGENRCATVTFPLPRTGEKCHSDESTCRRPRVAGVGNRLRSVTGEATDGEHVDIVELLARSELTAVNQRRVHNALVNNMIEGWMPGRQASTTHRFCRRTNRRRRTHATSTECTGLVRLAA